MAVELKNNFNGGMDLDTDLHLLPKNKYIDALNITRDSVGANSDDVPTNLYGNRFIPYSQATGTNKTIGRFPFPLRGTVIYFIYNSNGKHTIAEFNAETEVITTVFRCFTDSDTDILGFTETGRISNVNVFPYDTGDLLFFVDSIGRPTTINIDRFKNNEYNPVTRDIINVAKRPPLSPPDAVYDNDTTRRVNGTRNKFFKFQQVWVFDDNEESTFSPQSSMPIPNKILDETFTSVITNNNVIRLSLLSGPQNVKEVRLLMSFVDKNNTWSPFATVEVINKTSSSIADNTVFNYNFYNDSVYPTYDPARAIQLFDWVPDTAGCQEMANGNTLEFADITEGLDRTLSANVVNTISTVAAGGGGSIGSLNAVSSQFGVVIAIVTTTFSGVPATGTIILMTLIRVSTGLPVTVATYTTIAGDTSATVATAIAASINGLGIGSSAVAVGSVVTFQYVAPTYNTLTTTITAPATSSTTNSFATWLWSTERDIAIEYFTQAGKTNGVLYSGKITFPAYAENVSHVPLLPYINTKIYHAPPDWAYSYQILFSKEPTKPLFWHTVDVNTAETDYIYFDVTNMLLNATKFPTTTSVLNYSFVDGDRLRLIRRMDNNTVYADTYDALILGLVVNPTINGIVQLDKQFIKIKKISPFSTVNYASKYFVIEIYRPGQQVASGTNETFYEIGEEYPILNPTTATRVHGGQVTDQSTDYVTPAEINFYNGDSYFRTRTIPISESGVATFYVQDLNVVDFYTSAVSSISGRPSVIDVNQKEANFPATIRFSQDIQPNTNINRLNRFFPENFIDADASYGAIKRIAPRDRQLEIFQYLKTGFSPLFSQIGKAPGGDNVLLTTDKLLNPVQYYTGDWGIGEAKASLAQFGYVMYFFDTTKGAIIRLSRDGLTNLSELYKYNSWSTEQIPLRITDNIIGVVEQRTNNYIFSLAEVTSGLTVEPATTRSFSERTNSFGSRLSFIPDEMCSLGTQFMSWKNGQLWMHDADTYNNFYGVQYPSSITAVWNDNVALKKKFLAIGYQSKDNIVWESPETGDVKTSAVNSQTGFEQISQLKTADYELQETVLNAGFLRDANSMMDAREALVNGDYLAGNYIITKLVCPATKTSQLVNLIMPYITYIPSSRNF